MQVVIQGFNAIVQFVVNFITILWNALAWLLDAVLWVFVQLFLTLVVGIFTVIYTFVSLLDLGTLGVNAAAAWGMVDPNIAGGINAMGLPTGLTIIGGSIIVRMIINLIPAAFTRI